MTRQLLAFTSKRLQIFGVAFLILFLILNTQSALSQDDELFIADEPSLIPDASLELERSGVSNHWYSPINKLGITGSLRGGYWSSNRLNDNELSLIHI